MDFKGWLVYSAYRAGARVTQALPEPTLGVLGRWGGRIGGYPQRSNRKMAARHQARVRGRTDPHAVDEVFECYGRYWLEILRLPAEVERDNVVRHFEVTGYEHLEAGLAAGNGVILALPHLGGWEWAAAWVTSLGHNIVAVVEDLEPPELLDWFVRQREAYGLEVVPLGPDVSATVLKALRDNRIVALLSDRDLSGDGIEVEFFGEKTTLPAGPAMLALRTGAVILPTAVYFRAGRGHFGDIGAPVDTERHGRLREDAQRITQDIARRFEVLIRKAPEQWHLLQPNWPSDRV
jgi:KDO2-lipid IV(A) lauroyltransferase